MFNAKLYTASPAHEAVYGFYERLYTSIDVLAALSFVVGSVMFFSEAWATLATWFFLIGSICFAAKPCARFAREFHLGRLPLPEDD